MKILLYIVVVVFFLIICKLAKQLRYYQEWKYRIIDMFICVYQLELLVLGDSIQVFFRGGCKGISPPLKILLPPQSLTLDLVCPHSKLVQFIFPPRWHKARKIPGSIFALTWTNMKIGETIIYCDMIVYYRTIMA